jgi:hypothetical protein
MKCFNKFLEKYENIFSPFRNPGQAPQLAGQLVVTANPVYSSTAPLQGNNQTDDI